jgi:hypothetical protein
MTQTANLVLRILALILIPGGVMIVLAEGWARGLSPIVVGLPLIVGDVATRRRRDARPARS